MTTRFPCFYHCVLSAIFVGACGFLGGCSARSGMLDEPEDDLPTWQGTGGISVATGGSAGTSETTGATSWAGGGAGGVSVGAGGTRGIGGAGGAPATGGTGGGSLGSCKYPSCLWNLIGECLAVGQCTQDDSGGAGSVEITKLCCSNGVNEHVTLRTDGSRYKGTVAVTKNGKKCYDVDVTTSGDGSTINYVWVDPSGQAVAKASIGLTNSSTPIITCGNGESMSMTDQCAPDGSQAADITGGTCK